MWLMWVLTVASETNKVASDFGIGRPGGDEPEHLDLAGGQLIGQLGTVGGQSRTRRRPAHGEALFAEGVQQPPLHRRVKLGVRRRRPP